MADGTKKTTTFSNIQVAYTTYNLPSPTPKPTLCFIHGWCCSSALWSAQSPLYKNHPSILIDLPGHGESSKPENVDYNPEFQARAIHAVLQTEQITAVILIGHSMGGCISTLFLRLYGEDIVKGIIYVSSFWLMPVHYLSSEQRKSMGASLREDGNVMAMFQHAWGEKSTASIREQVRRTLCEVTPLHVRLSAVMTDALPQHWRWEEVFDRTPMLQITYRDAPEWDEQSARHLPRLVTERWNGVSVFLFMEDGERFNTRVERFLTENGLG